MKKTRAKKAEMLRFIHQSQHEEALQHRQTIFNVFALALAGLLAMLGGVVSVRDVDFLLSGITTGIIIGVTYLVVRFIGRQRCKTEEAMDIMRAIEAELGLYEEGAYLPCCQTVLPKRFMKPPKTWWRLTGGDWRQVAPLALAAFGTIVIVWIKALV